MLSREELDELLKHFPSFIDMEPPITNMNYLFPIAQRILVEVDNDPEQSFTARAPFGTLNSAIEVIMPMKRYSTMQMAKIVRNIPSFHYFSFFSPMLHLTLVYLLKL